MPIATVHRLVYTPHWEAARMHLAAGHMGHGARLLTRSNHDDNTKYTTQHQHSITTGTIHACYAHDTRRTHGTD